MIHTLLAIVLSTHPCHDFLDADLDRSGRVDVVDLIDVLLCYGTTACDQGDANRDNVTDLADLLLVLNNFGLEEDAVCEWIDVHTPAELQEIRLDGNYRIVNDLNFGPSWAPIGQHQADPFQGTLVALPGVTLNNLRVDHPTGHPYHDLGSGLFGWIVGGYIRGLHFVEPEIEGGQFTATLCGYAVFGRIEDVTVSDGYVVGDRYTGGLVGEARGAKIVDCHVEAVVNAEYNGSYYTGGIVGLAYSVVVISRCSAEVLMFIGWRDHGGIAGRLNDGIIRRSTAFVVLGTSNNPLRGGLGGIVGGMHNALVEDCYATGSIFVVSRNGNNSPYAGGLVGACWSGGQVHRSECYGVTIQYTGDEPSVGAAVGRRGGTWGPWSDVFYDWRSPWPGCGDGYGDGIFPGPQ